MMGSFITRAVILVLGYVYPAYECFKVVERNRPDFEQLRFWCQYWIIIAALTVFERLGDVLVSWVPMYSEAKLAFIVYLWYPKTQGTSYVYSTFLRPFVAKHEAEIDRQLNELTTRAGDLAFFWWQRGSVYIQARFYELLSYVASQSNRGPVARQVPPRPNAPAPPRPNAPAPPRGSSRDPPQAAPQTFPPPPPAAGSGAGYPQVNVEGLYPPTAPQQAPALYPPPAQAQAQAQAQPPQGLYPPSTGSNHRHRGSETQVVTEDSDSDYDVIEHTPENRSNPSAGEQQQQQQQEAPPRVYNTRNRQRSSGSRNWSEYLYSWVGSTSSSEKVD